MHSKPTMHDLKRKAGRVLVLKPGLKTEKVRHVPDRSIIG